MNGHPIGSLCVITKTMSGRNVGATVKILSEPYVSSGTNVWSGQLIEKSTVQAINPVGFWLVGPHSTPGNRKSQRSDWMVPLEGDTDLERVEDEELVV